MKTILLIGLGRFGRHVAMKLHELNHQVMAVDQDEEKVNRILPYVTSANIACGFHSGDPSVMQKSVLL